MTPPSKSPNSKAPNASLLSATDLSDPHLAPYVNLRDAHLARAHPSDPDRAEGLFIAEGHAVVRTLLASRFETLSVLASERRVHTVQSDVPDGVPLYVLPDDAMNELVGFDIHRGVLAAGKRRPPPPLADLAAAATTVVALEGLSNHDNVGSIFRLAAALGGDRPRVLLDPASCDPLYRKSIRVSMGHALRVPFARVDNLPAALRSLRDQGFDTLALETTENAVDLAAVEPTGRPRVVVVGAEGPGLTPETLAAVDRVARIPIDPGVPSLNVATAAAIALYQLAPPPLPSPPPRPTPATPTNAP
ncbi:MAG: RNA methyltransferase [Planctomycetota bacterium]